MKNFLFFLFLALAAIVQAQPQPSTDLVWDAGTQSWYEITSTPRLLGDSATYVNYLQVQYDQIAAELSALVSAVEAKKTELRRAQRAVEEAAQGIGVDVVGEVQIDKWTGNWTGKYRDIEIDVRVRQNNKGIIQLTGLGEKPLEIVLKDNNTAVLREFPAAGIDMVLYRKGRDIISEDGTLQLQLMGGAIVFFKEALKPVFYRF